MADEKKKEVKKAPKKASGTPEKKSKIEVNPVHIGMDANYTTESTDIDLIETILNVSKSLDYNLTELEAAAIEYKAYKNLLPFDVLESIFKVAISESSDQPFPNQHAFSFINSLISKGTISEYLVMSDL